MSFEKNTIVSTLFNVPTIILKNKVNAHQKQSYSIHDN